MLLGSTATYALIRNTEGITKIRGKWVDIEINKNNIPPYPLSPCFFIKATWTKKYSWEDLKSLKKKLNHNLNDQINLLDFEKNFNCPVAGVDEVGRGPLAGPVVAAAVILDKNNLPEGIRDSKKISKK